MTTFFKPYEGTRPFLFISYAHMQSDAVVDTIRILHEKGWRLWYDEGIPAGSDWPANIARHMQDCQRVIFFLSARAMESHNCFSEIATAVRQGKKLLIVPLEDVSAAPEWKELLAGQTTLPLLDTPEKRAEAILRSRFLPRRFHRSWTEAIPWRAIGLLLSLCFFLTASAALGAMLTGRWNPVPGDAAGAVTLTPEPTAAPSPTPVPIVTVPGESESYFAVKFPDEVQERAIRRALKLGADEPVYRWQLADIPALYCCGRLTLNSLDDVAFDAEGVCRVNTAPMVMGPVSDLSLLSYAVRLEELGLLCQPLGDLSSLASHVLLRRLSLAGSTAADLGALTELPSLETLNLEHTAVADLRPLDALPSLRTVTVSRDMLPLTWTDSAPYAVVLSREG